MSNGGFRRTTRWSVRVIDRLATGLITTGGMMVIFAIMGICVFLIWVVLPLFGGASAKSTHQYQISGISTDAPTVSIDIDEFQSLGVALCADGRLISFHARTGELVAEELILAPQRSITSVGRTLLGGYTALGLDDGAILLGKIVFTTQYLDHGSSEAQIPGLDPNSGPIPYGQSVIEWTPEQQLRVTTAEASFSDPMRISEDKSASVGLDYRVQTQGGRVIGEVLVSLSEEGSLTLAKIRRRQNLLTGEETVSAKNYPLPYSGTQSPPAYVLLNEQGNQLVLAWKDGLLHRYDLNSPSEPALVEKTTLLSGDKQLTDMRFLIGARSLITGDSDGEVKIWFPAPVDDESLATPEERLVIAHTLEPHEAAVTSIAASPRDRCLVSADSKGTILLRHATSEQTLARIQAPTSAELTRCLITPKADAIAVVDADNHAFFWAIDNPHPETTVRALFGPVWYEGYDESSFTWQSSSGSDDYEPKLSLMPLIFGTLKATVYSMLIAVPIAVLAAIYTSQFLHPRYRTAIKPLIEMMASLPSVVLGFVAALVLAPVVEKHLVGSLTIMFAVPLYIWVAGHLWQLLPIALAVRLSGTPRLVISGVLVLAAVYYSYDLGPDFEALFFAGDAMGWLDGRRGSGATLWGLLLFPPILGVALLAKKRWLDTPIQDRFRSALPLTEGLVSFSGMIVILLASLASTWILAQALNGLGFDPRGELAGTYVQRNTLVVGFVMGFAVIPIIYTIAEDALSSVPEHLKAGSLACGASQWQTTVRVVLPIAMSGIYSAVLIGLGRAVGETMIVVMAAGNTPIIDVNPFNGLRALSANIAVELPEAVKDSSLYRILFLSGLVLFAITFVINTVAEVIRLRLRKRAYQL